MTLPLKNYQDYLEWMKESRKSTTTEETEEYNKKFQQSQQEEYSLGAWLQYYERVCRTVSDKAILLLLVQEVMKINQTLNKIGKVLDGTLSVGVVR